MTIKARRQGNSLMVTLPRFLKVKEGTRFEVQKLEDGTIELVPSKKAPESMEELFKDWNGKYQPDPTMKEWDDIKPKGDELW